MHPEEIAQRVLDNIFIEIEASGRHVHVTKAQAQALFGHDLTPKRPLSQPGQFLAQERLTVIGPKGSFENVAVLGPSRKEAQVEISLTDAKQLGLTPPVRPSGTVAGSPGCVLQGPMGNVTLQQGVIAACFEKSGRSRCSRSGFQLCGSRHDDRFSGQQAPQICKGTHRMQAQRRKSRYRGRRHRPIPHAAGGVFGNHKRLQPYGRTASGRLLRHNPCSYCCT